MSQSAWNNILLDSVAVPRPLSDDRFGEWLATQRVFVSSAMDSELAPYRAAVKKYLQRFSPQVPVMWETLSPQDISPKTAFLTGVAQSSFFVLILGASYGVADTTGYSPTHQENNYAAERHLPRLLFTVPMDSSARDGRLNRWLGELYNDVSGSAAPTPIDLVAGLDARLRELAARSERLWLKLGHFLFPGKVEGRADRHGCRSFVITAQTFDHRIRQALMAINDPQSRRSGEMRLTWPNQSYPVTIESVRQNQQFAGEAEVEIQCMTPQNWHGNFGGASEVGSVNGHDKADLCKRWINRAFFNVAAESDPRGFDMLDMYTRPDGPTLPAVLSSTGANGWQAEGISSLYVIEEASRKWGAQFSALRAGPSTSSGVRLKGTFFLDKSGKSVAIDVDGVVGLNK